MKSQRIEVGDSMRVVLMCGAAAVLVAGLTVVTVGGQGGGQTGPGAGTRILEQAPTDRSVNVLGDTLARYLKEMDAHKLSTLRMVEGGKFNVNIRRITNAETALTHPKTIDVWVVLEGGGTMTTGGKIEKGKIVGGVSTPLKVGDVYFVPAGVPHGVSGVNGNITWLNVRWDVDWPKDATLGAGMLQPPPAPAGGGARRPFLAPLEYAPSDKAVYIPKEKLAGYIQDMEAKQQATLRMIEGGHFNVNIRRVKAPSAEHHPVTADTWVLLEGGGIVSTGFRNEGNKRVEGTGVSSFARVGDLFFIPSNLNHGFSAVDSVVAWLNIRWDTNWGPAQSGQ
jgi:mannose-6-phosphate isomerase-like protein (cupin superfamily)